MLRKALGTAPLCLLLFLIGCSTTEVKPSASATAAPQVVYKVPSPEVYAGACNRVVVQKGLTNEGLAMAFKAQDAQLKECTAKVRKALDDWAAKQASQPVPPKAKPKYFTQCEWWEHIFGGCQL